MQQFNPFIDGVLLISIVFMCYVFMYNSEMSWIEMTYNDGTYFLATVT